MPIVWIAVRTQMPYGGHPVLYPALDGRSLKARRFGYDDGRAAAKVALLSENDKENGMKDEARFLVDVGMRGLPLPMVVPSRVEPKGQHTVANISVRARIMHEFEAEWIDWFIQILHSHRDQLGPRTLATNIKDYMERFKASMVRVDFEYPFFVEKLTPVAKEKCLVRYLCTFSVKASAAQPEPGSILSVQAPAITSWPAASDSRPGALFDQLSVVTLEVASNDAIFPEDLVDVVDHHSLVPVYSFLTKADQEFIIEKAHATRKTSVEMMHEIKEELRRNPKISSYSVHCANFGMLHSYHTFIGTEKSVWVPLSGYEDSAI